MPYNASVSGLMYAYLSVNLSNALVRQPLQHTSRNQAAATCKISDASASLKKLPLLTLTEMATNLKKQKQTFKVPCVPRYSTEKNMKHVAFTAESACMITNAFSPRSGLLTQGLRRANLHLAVISSTASSFSVLWTPKVDEATSIHL